MSHNVVITNKTPASALYDESPCILLKEFSLLLILISFMLKTYMHANYIKRRDASWEKGWEAAAAVQQDRQVVEEKTKLTRRRRHSLPALLHPQAEFKWRGKNNPGVYTYARRRTRAPAYVTTLRSAKCRRVQTHMRTRLTHLNTHTHTICAHEQG